MIRKLLTVAAALMCVAALGLSTAGTAEARTVIPKRGMYSGMDHMGNRVTFHFAAGSTEVTNFYVGGQAFQNAPVASDAWHERCNGGWCFKGHWVSSSTAVGEWRHGSSHEWHAWSASVPNPYIGTYMGDDHQGNAIKASFNGTHVHSFSVNGYGDFPSARVGSDGYWSETCSRNFCYKGHFDDDYYMVGEWRTPGSVWHPWEARAFSS